MKVIGDFVAGFIVILFGSLLCAAAVGLYECVRRYPRDSAWIAAFIVLCYIVGHLVRLA